MKLTNWQEQSQNPSTKHIKPLAMVMVLSWVVFAFLHAKKFNI